VLILLSRGLKIIDEIDEIVIFELNGIVLLWVLLMFVLQFRLVLWMCL